MDSSVSVRFRELLTVTLVLCRVSGLKPRFSHVEPRILYTYYTVATLILPILSQGKVACVFSFLQAEGTRVVCYYLQSVNQISIKHTIE